MDLFNNSAIESEKVFLKNRIRAVFGSTEMLVHGIIKILLSLLFVVGGFSLHIRILGSVFLLASAVSTFLMFDKMQGERKYSPLGAKIYSILTLVEGILLKVYIIGYCAFIMSAMFGRSLFGKYSENASVLPYKMGFWCIPVVILALVIFAYVSQYFKYQRRFAENVYDCVDAQLVFFSTERKYVFQSFLYAFIAFVYNIFKMLCPSWYKMNILPAKLAVYLDSGVIIEKYNILTFIALLLISAHFVLSGMLCMKYIAVIKKLKKKVDERHAS